MVPLLISAFAAYGQDAVWTAHYDNFRTGANAREHILTPGNVSPQTFGRLGRLPVRGCVAAQPLFVPDVEIPAVGKRNVVYVATTSNYLYGFDADDFTQYFERLLGEPPSSSEMNPAAGYYDFPRCDGVDDQGPVGVVGTPVIDVKEGALYAVAGVGDDLHLFHHYLHKIDVRTGSDLLPPVEITGSFGFNVFNSRYQLQRSALLLGSGRVYIAFASHDDEPPYQGWLFAYDTSLKQAGLYNYSPERSGAGIWQSGGGPALGTQYIFLTTGNNYEGIVGPNDNADSILQIDPLSLKVTAKASFPNEANDWDYSNDIDLGSARAIVMPGTPYLVAGSKYGDIFVINRTTMEVVSRFQASARHSAGFDWTGIYNGMAVWNNRILVWPGGGGASNDPEAPYQTDVLKSFRVDSSGGVKLEASGQTDGVSLGYQGANLVVSASSRTDRSAIVWAATPEGNGRWLRLGHLRAYAANSTGVFTKLWADTDTPDPEGDHSWAKFSQPLIANGRVYLPTYSGAVMVYGLLPRISASPSTR